MQYLHFCCEYVFIVGAVGRSGKNRKLQRTPMLVGEWLDEGRRECHLKPFTGRICLIKLKAAL